MLQDDEIFDPTDLADRTPERLGRALNEAVERGDWEAVLALLRKGPTFLPQHTIAFLRGSAYDALGHKDTAQLFFSHPARIDPQYHNLPALLLRAA